jgi:tRNA 2-thiouridine synthesizing protein C
MAKKFLFILGTAPVSGVQVQETLDQILTTAAMEQSVSLLFLDDGVFQLVRNQQPLLAGRKDIALIYQALPIYDVEELWVEAESMQERGLVQDDLTLVLQPIPRAELGRFVAGHDLVVHC